MHLVDSILRITGEFHRGNIEHGTTDTNRPGQYTAEQGTLGYTLTESPRSKQSENKPNGQTLFYYIFMAKACFICVWFCVRSFCHSQR